MTDLLYDLTGLFAQLGDLIPLLDRKSVV
jgi:hypothetical protein